MPVILRWLLRLGPTNPIAVRLVQNASRRTRHMYIRSAYLGVLILALLWLLILGTKGGALNYRDLAAAAAGAFTSISYLQIFLICVLAPVFMGGAIAQEANPRTWEVLLTTPLSATQIVLGNLLGRLFFVLALLFASLPLFALTQYFGGVPWQSIFGSYLIAACAAILVGAIAIALSVSRQAGKRAFFVFYVCVVSYLALTWAIDKYLASTGKSVLGGNITAMTALNPFLTLNALLEPSSHPRAAPGTYRGVAAWLFETPVQTWCYASLLLSLFFVFGSIATARLGGLQSFGSESGAIPWYRKLFGFGVAGAEHRPPRTVWTNPIAWREAAARNATLGKTIARWGFVAAGAIFGIVLIALHRVSSYDDTNPGANTNTFQLALTATVWGELAVITLVAINMASTAISREREDGTLDILLTTPITPSAYLKGKLRGLLAYLLPLLAVPLGTLLLAGLYVLFDGFAHPHGVSVLRTVGAKNSPLPIVLPEAGLLAPIVILPFMAFCVMLGLNQSLRSKGTIGSVVVTVGILGAVAGVMGLCSWQAGSGINVVGPIFAALSPASLVSACITPDEALASAVGANGLAQSRVVLALGCLLAAAMYFLICYGIHNHMVRTFDTTVRKLAGVK